MVACHRRWRPRDISLSFVGPAAASWMEALSISCKFFIQQRASNVGPGTLEAAFSFADRADFFWLPANLAVSMALRRRLLVAHSRLRGGCCISADRFFFATLARLGASDGKEADDEICLRLNYFESNDRKTSHQGRTVFADHFIAQLGRHCCHSSFAWTQSFTP